MDNIRTIWSEKIDPLSKKQDGVKFYARTLQQMIETEFRKAADKMNALGVGYTTIKSWAHEYQGSVHLDYQSPELNSSSVHLLGCKVYQNGTCDLEWGVAGGLNYHNPQRWVEGNRVLVTNGILTDLIQGIFHISLQVEKLRKTLEKKETKNLELLTAVKNQYIKWSLEKLRKGDWLETNDLMFRYRNESFYPDNIQWVIEKSGRRGSLNFTVAGHKTEMDKTPITSVMRILEEMFLQMT